jgi:UDP-glucuronate 4-epimerase
MPDQAGDVPYTCADVKKAHKLLGYKAKVSFEEGIKRTAHWYREYYGAQQDCESEAEVEVDTNTNTVAPPQAIIA